MSWHLQGPRLQCFIPGSEKPRWARKGFRSWDSPMVLSASVQVHVFLTGCFLLKPIQYIIDLRFPYWLPILLGINLHLLGNSFLSFFFSLLFSFSLPLSALLKHRIVVINLDSGIYLVEMIVNSVNCKFFLHYVNLRNRLDFNPSFLFCKMGMLVTRTAHGDKMNVKMTGTGACT